MNYHRIAAIVNLLEICNIYELQRIKERLDKIWEEKNKQLLIELVGK